MYITWEAKPVEPMSIRDIPNGTTFTGQIAHYPARLFLCAGGEAKVIVALDYPEHTWTISECGKYAATVANYKEVSVSLHVRE